MKNKKEVEVTILFSKDATNIQVGKELEKVFNFFLENKAKAIIVKILPNENQIYVKPLLSLKLKKETAISCVNMVLKDELRDTAKQQFAFMFAETINDIWNKYMADEFFLKIYEDDEYHIEIGWNQYMSPDDLKKYWFKNESDGYNINAPFWTREWLRDEHKTPTTSGGKVN